MTVNDTAMKIRCKLHGGVSFYLVKDCQLASDIAIQIQEAHFRFH